MKRPKLYIAGSIIALGLLGWLVGQVGEVGVRRNSGDEAALIAQSPLVPGVPFSVSWPVDPDERDRSVLLKLRLAGGEAELAATRFVNGAMNAEMPCEVLAGAGTLLLTELLTGKVLASTPVDVLSAGPDCF